MLSRNVLSVTLALTTMSVSCTQCQNSSQQVAKVETKSDYFQKKNACADYIKKEKDRIEKESITNRQSLQVFQGVCYSKKYDTCVSFYLAMLILSDHGKSTHRMTSYSAVNLLTDEAIIREIDKYDEHGKLIGENERNADEEFDNLKARVECAD
jgi:hypothetical protein